MNFWQNIQPRERLFLGGAGAMLVLFLIFKFAIDPLFKHSADLDRQMVTARRQFAELPAEPRGARRTARHRRHRRDDARLQRDRGAAPHPRAQHSAGADADRTR